MTTQTTLQTPVDGTQVVVDRSGGAAGPTLVWLHGQFGALDGLPGRDTLAEQFDVVEIHLPGWGVADGGDRFDSIGELASVVWWALESMDLGKISIAGHGFGATLAVELAIQQPGSVRSLALAAPFGLFRADDPGVDMFALLPRDLQPHLYSDPKSELVARHFPPPADAYEKGLSSIRRVQTLGSTSRYIFPIPDTNITGRGYRLADVPMRLWFGAQDGVVPVSLAADWQSVFPHAQVEVVDRAGHMVASEHEGFAAELAASIEALGITN